MQNEKCGNTENSNISGLCTYVYINPIKVKCWKDRMSDKGNKCINDIWQEYEVQIEKQLIFIDMGK